MKHFLFKASWNRMLDTHLGKSQFLALFGTKGVKELRSHV